MATNRKLGANIFVSSEIVDAANVRNYQAEGKLLTKEQIAKKAFEFFTKYYDEKKNVADLGIRVKQK